MFCKYCGGEIPQGHRNCPFCGREHVVEIRTVYINQAPPQPTPSSRTKES